MAQHLPDRALPVTSGETSRAPPHASHPGSAPAPSPSGGPGSLATPTGSPAPISREGARLAGAFAMMAVAFVFLWDLSIGINNSRLILTPSFIAFILFAIAASRLQHIDPRVRVVVLIATVFAIVAAIEFLAALAGARPSASFAGPGVRLHTEFTPWTLVDLVVLVGSVVIVWLLCGAIAAFAQQQNKVQLVEMAKTRRLLYVILNACIIAVAYSLAGFLAMGGVIPPLLFVVLWTIAFFAIITMYVLLIHLALYARRIALNLLLDNDRGPPLPADSGRRPPENQDSPQRPAST